MALTQVDQGLLGTYAQYTGFKNRIINGAMMIDQRNAGASVTPTTANGTYATDRFVFLVTQATKITAQQSATAPAGFVNSLLVTSSSAYSVLPSDFFGLKQVIEGFNVADFGWGAAGAQAVTLSFWVRSSLTGTFGGSVYNSAGNRIYPFAYTISAANTFEYKTVTIPGDTTGTWVTTNGAGLQVFFNLGAGSNYTGTAGAWATSGFAGPTGATSVVGTSGATFYITGVQLEKGSTATSFDYRPYGTELALCQRYYEQSYDIGTVAGSATVNGLTLATVVISSVSQNGALTFKTTKRSSPTMAYWDSAGASSKGTYTSGGTWYTGIPITGLASNMTGATLLATGAGYGTTPVFVQWTANAEL